MRYVISTMIAITGLFTALSAQAAGQGAGSTHAAATQQFLSKRPYVQTVAVASNDAEQAWVGATLVVDKNPGLSLQQQQLKMHMLGKRAF